MDNKKNTILLTVIAVATLLVAVVGATFAYFTAQGGTTASTNVTVQTATADSSSFGTFTAITITADQETFAQGKGNRVGTSEGAVSFTASSATTGNAEFCYSVALNVTSNNFQYSSTQTADPKLAELIFKAEKKADGATDYTTLVNNADITVGTASVKVPNNGTCFAAKNCTNTDYIHKITAAASQEKSDEWRLTVELVNLEVDQNDNTNKSFVGAIKFDRVDCTTGAVIEQSTPTTEP